MTHREMFDEVVMSGKYPGGMEKVKRLAQLIHNSERSFEKEDCVVSALEKYEEMTGNYLDPTHEEWAEILNSIKDTQPTSGFPTAEAQAVLDWMQRQMYGATRTKWSSGNEHDRMFDCAGFLSALIEEESQSSV